jgi:hypothetical protein
MATVQEYRVHFIKFFGFSIRSTVGNRKVTFLNTLDEFKNKKAVHKVIKQQREWGHVELQDRYFQNCSSTNHFNVLWVYSCVLHTVYVFHTTSK